MLAANHFSEFFHVILSENKHDAWERLVGDAVNMADELDIINNIFNDSLDEEDFEGFDEEDVAEAAERLRNCHNNADEEIGGNDKQEPAGVWRGDEETVRQTAALPQFRENPGMKVDVPEGQVPVSYFDMFFTDTIVERIVTETNRYAEQTIANAELLPNSRAHSWRPLSAEELRLFFGVVFAMGLTEKLDIQL